MNVRRKHIADLILFTGGLLTAFSIGALVVGALLPPPFFGITAALGVLILFAGYRQRKNPAPAGKGIILLTAFLTIYAAGEIFLNVLVWTGKIPNTIPTVDLGFGVFNGPCAIYDPVRGYRWDQGEFRMTKIVNDVINYDRRIRPNVQGLYAPVDYSGPKQDSSVVRYIVFGDSFTAAEFLDTPWPERVNQLARADGLPVELYPFAINGGGLYNWHSTFFSEIWTGYEFDGIILASFTNDLERGFFVMEHTDSTGYTGYLDTIPADARELTCRYLDQLNDYAHYMPDSMIDLKVKAAEKNMNTAIKFRPAPYLLSFIIASPFIVAQNRSFADFLDQHLMPADVELTIADVEDAIGEKHFGMLAGMIDSCLAHDKTVLAASLPYKEVLRHIAGDRRVTMEAHLAAVAEHFNVPYYNGMAQFASLDEKSAAASFFPFDIHWNQEGSDRFAYGFYEFLKQETAGR